MVEIKKINKLAIRFSLYLILLSIGLSVFLTIGETYFNYKNEISKLNERLYNIKNSRNPSLTRALWFFDEAQVKQQMLGILEDPRIFFVEVKNPSVTISYGNTNENNHLISREYPLLFFDEGTQKSENIGSLFLLARIDILTQEVFHGAALTFRTAMIKTLCVSIFIFMVFRFLVTRHLSAIEEFTKRMNINNLSEKLRLKRVRWLEGEEDEFNFVVAGLNEMNGTLQRELAASRKIEEVHLAQRNLMNNVLLNIPSSIYWKNKKLEFQGCNENFLKDTGFSHVEEVIGLSEYNLPWSASEKELFNSRDNEILKTGNAVLLKESTIKLNREEYITLLISVVPMFNKRKEIEGVLGIYTDVTEVKKIENQLSKLNNSLEEKILERTNELNETHQKNQKTLDKLNDANESLVEAEKMAAIGSLVAGVAHEINTPLGIGVTAASFLQTQTKELQKLIQSGKMTKRNFSQFVETSNESIIILLKNLTRAKELIFSFQQVTSDQMTEENRQFQLKEYINEIILSLRPKLKTTKHEIKVDIDDSIELYSNPGALSHVVTNLIMNSLIHAFDEKETGIITFSATRVDENNISFIYSDNGKGIPEENIKLIYEPFFTTKRGSGGSGLGLHIFYTKITVVMKGQVKCRSVLGQGTTFEMLLPIKI